nr:YhdP family protein [Alteromonas sp. ASW11-130]
MLLRKLWVTLAILLVVFAVVLSVLRYTLPHIEHKKHMLEDYAREIYGVELSIESVHAVWESDGPSIVLTNVALEQNESSPVALNIENVFVQFNLWQSILSGKISSEQFNLDGLRLTINMEQAPQSDNDFPIVGALKSLFLEQLKSFSLHDGKVTLARKESERTFNIKHLSWLNNHRFHRGEGQVSVETLTRNTATFLIDLEGSKDNLSGMLYARGDDLDISPWVSHRLAVTRPLTQSKTNLESWISIKNSKIDRVVVDFHESLLEWGGNDEQTFYSGVMGGSFQALPDATGWNFRVDRLIFNANNESIVTDLVGHYNNNGDIVINTIKPVAVNPFASMLPLLISDTQDNNFTNLNPQGQIATLQFQWKNSQPYLAAKILDVSWEQQGQLPGVDSLDLDVQWHGTTGFIRLKAEQSTLLVDDNFSQNLPINSLNAKLYIYEQSNSWVVSSSQLTIVSEPLVIEQAFNLRLNDMHLAYQANLSDVPLAKVSSFFPAVTMGKDTAQYLTAALAGIGNVESARVLWHGHLEQFPFKNNNGIFQAAVDIKDSHLLFSDDWPVLTDLNLTLLFENAGLTMHAPFAKLQTIDVAGLRAEIPDMLASNPMLTIQAQGKGTGTALASLMMQSELKKSLGTLFSNEVMIDGPITADLNLRIPLSDTGEFVAAGEVNIKESAVTIDSVGLILNQVNGQVSFVNDVVTASALDANIYNQPVTIDFKGRNDEDSYHVGIQAAGEANIQEVLTTLNSPLVDYFKGAAPVNAKIDLTLPEEGFVYQAEITADLLAVASLMPAPLDKNLNINEPLKVEVEGNEHSSLVMATVGQTVQFDGVLSHSLKQFTRAHVSLGESDFISQGLGLSIVANVDSLDAHAWYDFVSALTEHSESSTTPLFTLPERIYLNAKEVKLAGITLSNVKSVTRQKDNNWYIDLQSKQASAQINLSDDWLGRGIYVNADFIQIDDWKVSDTDSPTQWRAESMPPLYFYCKQCRYADKQLGEVTLAMAKMPEGMSIRTLRAEGKHGVISATGSWVDNDERSETNLSGQISSDEIGLMLSDFGIDTGIKDSEADLSFTLNWADSPMDFSVANLGGEVKWELTDGYLSELSDKGSRLFTLFSLNSLIRKLSLDFRDVFAKGFFYDEIHGSMQIGNGKAVTRDTEVDGGAGEITINGYTDLVKEQLNYRVSFAPNVTGNLPFLVYFLATPPTALAALALDQMLTSAKVISNVNYRVTGTISNPVFEEVGRDSKDVPLPARSEPTGKNDTIEQELDPVKLEVNNG